MQQCGRSYIFSLTYFYWGRKVTFSNHWFSFQIEKESAEYSFKCSFPNFLTKSLIWTSPFINPSTIKAFLNSKYSFLLLQVRSNKPSQQQDWSIIFSNHTLFCWYDKFNKTIHLRWKQVVRYSNPNQIALAGFD